MPAHPPHLRLCGVLRLRRTHPSCLRPDGEIHLQRTHRLAPCVLLAIAVVGAGCQASPVAPRPVWALGHNSAEVLRDLKAVGDPTAEPWIWTANPDAPWSPFGRAEHPDRAQDLHLDFHARAVGAVIPNGANKVYFRDGVTFTLRIVEGANLAVLDADATDGEATVALPAGAYDGYLARLGRPGGTLTAKDPIFFRRESLLLDGGPLDWVRLGVRAVPFAGPAWLGPDRLEFTPAGVEGFSTRWSGGRLMYNPNGAGHFIAPWVDDAVAEPVPLPPLIADFTVPPEGVAGDAEELAAYLSGASGLPPNTVFRWQTVDPDAHNLPDTIAGEPLLPWQLPAAPGVYQVDLRVETPYFVAHAPAPRPVDVRREFFLDSYAPFRAEVADSYPLATGVTYQLSAEGTINPWGSPNWPYYCGAPEPSPMYDSPNRPTGVVALDPGFFFAWLNLGPCGAFTGIALPAVRFSLDGGQQWIAATPKETTIQATHRYTYPPVVGTGKPLRAQFNDNRTGDNYGRFKIIIRR